MEESLHRCWEFAAGFTGLRGELDVAWKRFVPDTAFLSGKVTGVCSSCWQGSRQEQTPVVSRGPCSVAGLSPVGEISGSPHFWLATLSPSVVSGRGRKQERNRAFPFSAACCRPGALIFGVGVLCRKLRIRSSLVRVRAWFCCWPFQTQAAIPYLRAIWPAQMSLYSSSFCCWLWCLRTNFLCGGL